MKLWYGRWISNYKDGDGVIALLNSGEFTTGNIYFTNGRSDFYVVLSETQVVIKDDIYSICPNEWWYLENMDLMFEAATEPKKQRGDL